MNAIMQEAKKDIRSRLKQLKEISDLHYRIIHEDRGYGTLTIKVYSQNQSFEIKEGLNALIKELECKYCSDWIKPKFYYNVYETN
jgi:RNase P subunit RPR2